MTNDEIRALYNAHTELIDDGECSYPRVDYLAFARALESRVLAERKQEPVAQIIRRKTYSGLDVWDIKIFDKDMQHGTKLFAAPPAQSAEQDRTDADFIGAEWRAIFNEVCTGASFEKFCEWMREEIGVSK